MRYKRAHWWIAGAVLLALVPLGVRIEHHLGHHGPLRTGDRLTPLSLASIDGSTAILAPAGRPQVINVFATWCTPCRSEMPAFALMAARFQRRGIDVVGIDQEESASQVTRFAREFALPYRVYIDRDGVTHTVLGARMIPTTIYVDGRGVIRWQHAGPLTQQDMLDLALLVRSAG